MNVTILDPERLAHRIARACFYRSQGEKYCAEREDALEFFEGKRNLNPLETIFFNETRKILVAVELKLNRQVKDLAEQVQALKDKNLELERGNSGLLDALENLWGEIERLDEAENAA